MLLWNTILCTRTVSCVATRHAQIKDTPSRENNPAGINARTIAKEKGYTHICTPRGDGERVRHTQTHTHTQRETEREREKKGGERERERERERASGPERMLSERDTLGAWGGVK
jgi:hypothetical protein